MGAVEGIRAHEFLEEIERLVVHDCDVVAIPAHWARHMEHQLGHIHQQCGYEIADVLRLLIVTSVERIHLLTGGAIGGVEIVRTHGIRLQSDAKQLRLEAVLHTVETLLHDFIERSSEDLAILLALHGHILRTIVHPDIHDARIALRLTHGIGNATTTLRVLNPKVTNRLIRIRQRELTTLRVGERCGVEVEHHLVLASPLYPTLEMLGATLIAVDKLSTEVTVDLMQIQAVVTSEQRLHELDVLTNLIDVTGTARIVTCGLNAT